MRLPETYGLSAIFGGDFILRVNRCILNICKGIFSDFVEEGHFSAENIGAAVKSRILLEGPEDYLLNSSGSHAPSSGLRYIVESVERLGKVNLSQQVRVLGEKVLGKELGELFMKGKGLYIQKILNDSFKLLYCPPSFVWFFARSKNRPYKWW